MDSTILILTNEDDAHADSMVQILSGRGADFVRFDPVHFPGNATISVSWEEDRWAYILSSDHKTFDLSQITSIWLRRPTRWQPLHIADRGTGNFIEAERRHAIDALWQSVDCFWVNNPAANRLAGLKPYHLAVASEFGLSVPRTLISNDPSHVMRFYSDCGGKIVYKTLSGTDDLYLDRSVFTSLVSSAHLGDIDRVATAPCTFQEYVPKSFEVRTTVIGNQTFSAAIFSQEFEITKHDWRKGQDLPLRYEPYHLPLEIEAMLLKLVSALDLAFGTIDMIVTPEGDHVFLEINPNGQFGFIEYETGLPIFSALADLLMKGGKEA